MEIEKQKFQSGRVFLFIDETGDPGHPADTSSSDYYQLNLVICGRGALKDLHKHIASFRYFNDSGKELKKHTRDAKTFAGILKNLSSKKDILFVSYILEKKKYTGPYLVKIKKSAGEFNPAKFKNFIIRMSLEHLFKKVISVNSERNNIEVVFDRYLESSSDEQNLKDYLLGNYRLPHFEHIVQVDSEYSEAIQISDYIGHFVKSHCFDGKPDNNDIFDFIKIFVLENPDSVCEKRPDTL